MSDQAPVPPIGELEKESLKFLERDFNQCFQQLRHYDGQMFEITKFVLVSYSGLIAVALGLYQFSLKERVDLVLPAMAALAVGILLGLFLFALTIRNRVYFVQVVRYVNEQRGLFFQYKPLGFENRSRMYTDYRQPPFFNWRSSHAWFAYIVASLNATLLGVLLFLVLIPACRLWGILGGTIGIFALQLILGIGYLRSREGKSAEEAVFGQKIQPAK